MSSQNTNNLINQSLKMHITVTETLASGLKNRFFYESTNEAEKIKKILTTELSKPAGNRSKFAKMVASTKKSLINHALLFYEGGSSSKPYIAFDLLLAVKDREYNSWNEKCLMGYSTLVNCNPSYYDYDCAYYSISEHTISRLFLRTQPTIKEGVIDCMAIKKELTHIPLWSNFWLNIVQIINLENHEGKIFPIIPTINGLLLCEFSKNTQFLEIRTFIDDKNLTTDQNEAKNCLIKIGADLNQSPLSISRIFEKNPIEYTTILFGILCKRLHKDNGWKAVKNTIFYRVKDELERKEAITRLDCFFEEVTPKIDMQIFNLFSEIGVGKFQKIINDAKLKNR
jgi:hypothetical protein